jgi:hypothetical protein
MSTLVKLCLASLIAVSMVPATSLASPSPASPQATPVPSTEADKQTNAPAKPHQPRPNPDASGKYHIGDGVTQPVLVHAVEPESAKTLRNNERCIVALTVGTDGKPTDVHIAPSSPASKNEDNGNLSIETRMICVNAAEQYRFKPATFQGKPVAVDLKVEISFKKFP